MKALLFIFMTLILCSCSLFQTKKKNWADFKTPFVGTPAALGSSSAGCLAGAQALSEKTESYILMRPSRERVWGHPVLLSFLQDMALKTNCDLASLLLIGDMAQPRGGRLPGSHLSHQSGLDVDLWYELPESLDATFSREEFSARSLVKEANLWSDKHENFLRLIAEDARVERVFVNPELKKKLCQKFKGAKWLRPLRPWWGHDDHLHVRLQCPANDSLCEKGPILPEGDGCGKELAWWFSEEAKLPSTSTATTEFVDRTPAICEPLRTAP